MSILIKGMDMPKNCFDCPCFTEHGYDFCELDEERRMVYDGKPDWCPLVEVPTPHGKLADCDAVEECLHEVMDCDDKIYALGLLSWAANKRTVIEAEKGEKGDVFKKD